MPSFLASSGVIVNLLAIVLKVKVFFTLIFWSLPLLAFPASWFVRIGMPEPKPMLFLRLLGAAFLALVLAYTSGFVDSVGAMMYETSSGWASRAMDWHP